MGRYIPLHTVTHRYTPLHTVTHRYTPRRTLAWAHHLSEGELLTTYLPKQHTLRVSGLQLCLLLCFNGFNSSSTRTTAQLSEVRTRLSG